MINNLLRILSPSCILPFTTLFRIVCCYRIFSVVREFCHFHGYQAAQLTEESTIFRSSSLDKEASQKNQCHLQDLILTTWLTSEVSVKGSIIVIVQRPEITELSTTLQHSL